MKPLLDIIDLGHRPYAEVLQLQREIRLGRIDGSVPRDVLLLVEHDSVYTLGRGTRETSMPEAADVLRARGADVASIERGGDVTWHGPGQLVGYPIIHLSQHREDLHWYLRNLEQVLIDALAQLEIAAERNPGKTGVWTRQRKIASIGIHVKQWVTLHGFALNIDPDLTWFDAIVPCGISGVEMTSVARELDRGESHRELWHRSIACVVDGFERAFGVQCHCATLENWDDSRNAIASSESGGSERGGGATLAIACPTGNP